MLVELFLCLLLAHLVADFALQTSKTCESKRVKRWSSCLAVVQVLRLECAIRDTHQIYSLGRGDCCMLETGKYFHQAHAEAL